MLSFPLNDKSIHVPVNSYFAVTPAFAAGLERSGKPDRQHALVMNALAVSVLV
jgi:hypothetical protein